MKVNSSCSRSEPVQRMDDINAFLRSRESAGVPEDVWIIFTPPTAFPQAKYRPFGLEDIAVTKPSEHDENAML